MMKKLIMEIVLIVCILFFTGCASSHNIPNGEYAATDVEMRHFTLRPEGDTTDYFWRIKGENADFYVSGSHTYRCKIIVEEGKFYFEGRKWFDILSWRELGVVFKYEIRYDESTKSITVITES